MIGYIRGKVKYFDENSLTLGDNVGYTVNTLSSNYKVDDEVELYTHMVVRENEISLWGFNSIDELKLFKMIINVSGVGPKTAMSLISNVGYQSIILNIQNGNHEGLKSNGIGAKTAQKLVIELQNKISNIKIQNFDQEISNLSIAQEALQALISLGYKENDLLPLINKILSEDSSINSTEQIIKKVLISI